MARQVVVVASNVSIGGDRPETGLRIHVQRDAATRAAPWSYAGRAYLPDASYALDVKVDEDGTVAVTLGLQPGAPPPPSDLAEKVRLILRAAYKQARSDGVPPPWRIVRWRGEK